MRNENTNQGTPFPARLLTGALILTGVVLVGLVWFTFGSYRNATTGQVRNLRIEELRGMIVHLDEVLTMSARMAAATGDSDWERRYRQFESQLDAAIKEAMAVTAHSDSAEAVAQTDAANLKLVEMEDRGFALVRAGEAGRAKAVLFSKAYEAQKKIYAQGMVKLIQHLKEKLAANQRQKQQEALFSIMAVAFCIVLFLFAWFSVLRRLNYWRAKQSASLEALTRAEEALRELNDGLEKRVAARTRELESIHKQLVEASRLGGMAEVATNVLHNVGNVLNSVNVSTDLIVESVKKSKTSSLARVVVLLREHAHDLGAFITNDSRGKHLPAHLAQLSEHLLAEQEANVRELNSLRQNVEHIKGIVAMQQSCAKVGGVKEMTNMVHLVEDSLRLNEGALSRQQVEVVREFANVPPLNVEKHKVLQILVNLLRNANHACQDSERADKRLTVRAANGGSRIKVSVMDNGVGIPPENLTRIFNHGFTTRKDGHGFGLHSGALAAKEMGGSLTVHSDGVGQGAAFTLELRCPARENSHE